MNKPLLECSLQSGFSEINCHDGTIARKTILNSSRPGPESLNALCFVTPGGLGEYFGSR